jgi:hypothetical protein
VRLTPPVESLKRKNLQVVQYPAGFIILGRYPPLEGQEMDFAQFYNNATPMKFPEPLLNPTA